MAHEKTSINRRSFLKSSALAGGGLMISFSWLSEFRIADRIGDPGVPEQWNELTGYIKITPDNIIKILNPNPEFGQNVMTSLPMIVAEELGVDWQQVVVEMGPHDSVKLGPQFTGGSNSTRMYWKPLREAGAAARHMLIDAAAQTWGVPEEKVTAKTGMLYHGKLVKKQRMATLHQKLRRFPYQKG
jgi:isoquinoline 1-oxidoreductase beta subunit